MTWKRFPRYWRFVRGNHRWIPHTKGNWCGPFLLALLVDALWRTCDVTVINNFFGFQKHETIFHLSYALLWRWLTDRVVCRHMLLLSKFHIAFPNFVSVCIENKTCSLIPYPSPRCMGTFPPIPVISMPEAVPLVQDVPKVLTVNNPIHQKLLKFAWVWSAARHTKACYHPLVSFRDNYGNQT